MYFQLLSKANRVIAMGDCIEKGGITRPAACLLLHLYYTIYGSIFVNEKHDNVLSTWDSFAIEVGDFHQYFSGITQVMDSRKISLFWERCKLRQFAEPKKQLKLRL